MEDEITRALEREFGCKVEREGATFNVILGTEQHVRVFPVGPGRWAAYGDTGAALDDNHHAQMMRTASRDLPARDTPAEAVRAALGAMGAAWERAEAERNAALPTASAVKRAINAADASPEARALNLAGIRRHAGVAPWRGVQATIGHVKAATAGGLNLGLRAMIEDQGNSYRAGLNLGYLRDFSDNPADGSDMAIETATCTHADPIVALHGAIVAVLAKMVRPSAKCDRVQCLTEARDNLARWLPSAPPTTEGTTDG